MRSKDKRQSTLDLLNTLSEYSAVLGDLLNLGYDKSITPWNDYGEVDEAQATPSDWANAAGDGPAIVQLGGYAFGLYKVVATYLPYVAPYLQSAAYTAYSRVLSLFSSNSVSEAGSETSGVSSAASESQAADGAAGSSTNITTEEGGDLLLADTNAQEDASAAW